MFRPAGPEDLRGESSTHYTKLPTYPRTVDRMVRDLPRLKFIYVMRHPIDRLVSQYVHEVTTGRVAVGLREALEHHPELIDYSRYSMQLQPFLEAYGFGAVLPVFFPRLVTHSQAELERIGRFLGHGGPLRWDEALEPQNQGRERLRPSPVREVLVQAPVLTTIRQRVVPRRWSRIAQGALAGAGRAPAVDARPRGAAPRGLRRRPRPARLLAGRPARLRELPRGDSRPARSSGSRLRRADRRGGRSV